MSLVHMLRMCVRSLFNDSSPRCPLSHFCFFFNDTATTEIYTLSLHDALPTPPRQIAIEIEQGHLPPGMPREADRKSTRLNSSHLGISYAVFCLKKKKKKTYKKLPKINKY